MSYSRINSFSNVLKTATFLVNSIKINFLYEIEETLLLCDHYQVTELLENKYKEMGIFITKAQVEEKYYNQGLSSSKPSEYSIGSNFLRNLDKESTDS